MTYISDRENILFGIAKHYDIKRDDSKKLILRLCFFGSVMGFLEQNKINGKKNDYPFLIGFKKELEQIVGDFKKHNSDLYETALNKIISKLKVNKI